MNKIIYLLLIILSSCGYIKKEYEYQKQLKKNYQQNIVKTKSILNDTIKQITYKQKYISFGAFKLQKNAIKKQNEIDPQKIFSEINFDGTYYKVLLNTNKSDSLLKLKNAYVYRTIVK